MSHSNYNHALKGEQAHTKSLRTIIFALIALSGGLGYGLYSVPKNLTIHNPPDLRTGSVRAWWEVPPSSVYAFSFYIFQQLNRWPTNGELDYKKNIEALQAYLTPSCQQFLADDYVQRKSLGELRDRVRGVYEIPGRGFSQERVQIVGKDDWYVTLDLTTDEYYRDEAVKRVLVRYPLHIVRYDVDPEKNPWGLALNCYRYTPQRLELKPKQETN
ncbi:TIGR03746 family integrating conjugative element protein [Pasteurella skyensis]|uniref:PFL_4703 family integrating conjugative element protein n=1 Tax=Phocoenobacter skyensis TaxID=97481 RepID=UPI0027480EE1|nr:TIGR03746 family integrating conjugative element protein [Pasteurella skyensis]MDP8189070.1 TIGR03746 family integrating conjugative element protein [Pasteurella skyensis]